jgi:predicted nucleic acid-binding protein
VIKAGREHYIRFADWRGLSLLALSSTVKKRIDAKRFLDTNVLVYAFLENDRRKEVARILLAEGGVIGVQTLNEFVAVAKCKLHMSWDEISDAVSAIRVLCPSPVPVTIETHEAALRIARRHGYGIFDSLVIAAALEASCETLYSEDMRDGQVIEGITISNPFVR